MPRYPDTITARVRRVEGATRRAAQAANARPKLDKVDASNGPLRVKAAAATAISYGSSFDTPDLLRIGGTSETGHAFEAFDTAGRPVIRSGVMDDGRPRFEAADASGTVVFRAGLLPDDTYGIEVVGGKITGAVITGGVVRTSDGGTRIEMSEGALSTLTWYGSVGAISYAGDFAIGGTGALALQPGGALTLSSGGAHLVDFAGDTGSAYFTQSGTLVARAVIWTGATTATSAAAGTASALPSAPKGYLLAQINGTVYKIPYYG